MGVCALHEMGDPVLKFKNMLGERSIVFDGCVLPCFVTVTAYFFVRVLSCL